MKKSYQNLKTDKKKTGEVKIEAQVTLETITEKELDILRNTQNRFELPGWRRGKVPIDIVRKHVNAENILHEAVEQALQEAYTEIIEDHALELVSRPTVNVEKIDKNTPINFTIQTFTTPEFSLPDYKKISNKILEAQQKVEITNDEIETVIQNVQKMRASKNEKGEEVVPELTDEFAKTLGAFSNVTELKEKIKNNLNLEKQKEKEKETRENIIDEIIEESNLSLPKELIEAEAKEIRNDLESSLKEAKMTLEEYLKRIKKTEEELKKEEWTFTERTLKKKFIIEKIGNIENVEPDADEVQRQFQLALFRNPEIDPIHAKHHLERLLRTEKIFELLESNNKENKS